MKLRVPNKINYLVLLTNKKKIKQFAGISSCKGNFSIIKQLQDDGTFMLNKNIQKKIVNNLIEHIKKFYSCESFYESAMAYWQQLVLSSLCHSSSTFPNDTSSYFDLQILHKWQNVILTLKTLGVTSI